MSTIRVDPATLNKAANDIACVAEQVLAAGNQIYQATQGRPSYEGQLGPPVASVGLEALARSRTLADRLLEHSAWLTARAGAFQAVDAASLQGLASIRQELLAWIHSQEALPLGPLFFPIDEGGRPPPGVSEEEWRRLTFAERIALWVDALRGDGRQIEVMPTIPVPPPSPRIQALASSARWNLRSRTTRSSASSCLARNTGS